MMKTFCLSHCGKAAAFFLTVLCTVFALTVGSVRGAENDESVPADDISYIPAEEELITGLDYENDALTIVSSEGRVMTIEEINHSYRSETFPYAVLPAFDGKTAVIIATHDEGQSMHYYSGGSLKALPQACQYLDSGLEHDAAVLLWYVRDGETDLCVYRSGQAQRLYSVQGEASYRGVISPDGNSAYFTVSENDTKKAFLWKDGALTECEDVGRAISLSDGAEFLCSKESDGSLYQRSLLSGEKVMLLSGDRDFDNISFNRGKTELMLYDQEWGTALCSGTEEPVFLSDLKLTPVLPCDAEAVSDFTRFDRYFFMYSLDSFKGTYLTAEDEDDRQFIYYIDPENGFSQVITSGRTYERKYCQTVDGKTIFFCMSGGAYSGDKLYSLNMNEETEKKEITADVSSFSVVGQGKGLLVSQTDNSIMYYEDGSFPKLVGKGLRGEFMAVPVLGKVCLFRGYDEEHEAHYFAVTAKEIRETEITQGKSLGISTEIRSRFALLDVEDEEYRHEKWYTRDFEQFYAPDQWADAGPSEADEDTSTQEEETSGSDDLEAAELLAGSGFSTPEDAVKTYLAGLRDSDFDRIYSAFAIEPFVDHLDLTALLAGEETQWVSEAKLNGYLPGEGAMIRELNLENRRGLIATDIRYQYLMLKGSPVWEIPRMGAAGAVSFAAIDGVDDGKSMAEYLFPGEDEDFIPQISFEGEYMDPEVFLKGRFDDEKLADTFKRWSAWFSPEEYQILIPVIRVGKEQKLYAIILGMARYDGAWYVAECGGWMQKYLSMSYLIGGVLPYEFMEN